MSFSSETKIELMGLTPQKKCCRRSLVAGLLYDADTDCNGRVLASFSTLEIALYAQRAIASAFGPAAVKQPPVAAGKGDFDLAVSSPEIVQSVGKIPAACAECSVSFLRGVLISTSSLTDPEKQYHFEIVLRHTERIVELSDFLAEQFGRPLTVDRKRGMGLVYKNSAIIEDMLSATGAMQTYFEFLNKKIERDLRNNANRATNCETRNIARAVSASKKQIDAIAALEAAGELDALPCELRETAELRRLHPDMPLSELGARHCPPISKSGINHRIAKILEAAQKLK